MPLRRFIPRDQDEDKAFDVRRIVEVCRARGVAGTTTDARLIWKAHSDSSAATWLFLPYDDNEIFDVMNSVSREIEDGTDDATAEDTSARWCGWVKQRRMRWRLRWQSKCMREARLFC